MKALSIFSKAMCVVLLWQGPVWADEAHSTVSLLDNTYLSIFAGGAFQREFEHGYTHVNPAENGNSTHDLDMGYIFGGAIGFHVRPNIRAELELSHISSDINGQTFDNPIFAASSGPASGKIQSTSLMVNAWYDFDAIERFRPYIGGGVGVSFLKGKSLLNGNTDHEFNDSQSAFAFQAGLGSQVEVSDRVSLDIGYRFRGVPNVTLKTEIPGQVNKSASLFSHTVQLGFRFKLNGQ